MLRWVHWQESEISEIEDDLVRAWKDGLIGGEKVIGTFITPR
jgi:hypothetical protein